MTSLDFPRFGVIGPTGRLLAIAVATLSLIGCGSVEIRQRVRVVFDQRIRGMLPF